MAKAISKTRRFLFLWLFCYFLFYLIFLLVTHNHASAQHNIKLQQKRFNALDIDRRHGISHEMTAISSHLNAKPKLWFLVLFGNTVYF